MNGMMLMNNESALQAQIRLEASRRGWGLWRNNVGAAYMRNGAFIRYGLANDSKRLNEHIKSGDLIGIKPIFITQEHVGLLLGQFVSREVKRPDWVYRGDEREQAQQNWIDLVRSLGGDAAFINDVRQL